MARHLNHAASTHPLTNSPATMPVGVHKPVPSASMDVIFAPVQLTVRSTISHLMLHFALLPHIKLSVKSNESGLPLPSRPMTCNGKSGLKKLPTWCFSW
ncbi:MAG: hypothetical protein MUP03_11295 [Anaerolineales bacterium]|nr:hypothetical protein [Anaerolineales bacterium]